MIILRNNFYSALERRGCSDLKERLFGVPQAILGSGTAANASKHFFSSLTRNGAKELAFHSGPKTRAALGTNVHAAINSNTPGGILTKRGRSNLDWYLFNRPF